MLIKVTLKNKEGKEKEKDQYILKGVTSLKATKLVESNPNLITFPFIRKGDPLVGN